MIPLLHEKGAGLFLSRCGGGKSQGSARRFPHNRWQPAPRRDPVGIAGIACRRTCPGISGSLGPSDPSDSDCGQEHQGCRENQGCRLGECETGRRIWRLVARSRKPLRLSASYCVLLHNFTGLRGGTVTGPAAGSESFGCRSRSLGSESLACTSRKIRLAHHDHSRSAPSRSESLCSESRSL